MRSSGHFGGGAGARILPILLLVMGTATSGLGLAQLVAALAAAPGDPVIAALDDDRTVGTAALDRLVRSRRTALAWSDSPRFHREIGRAGWILARRSGDDRPVADAAYRLAAEATESGLRSAPVDPLSWMRLAVIRLDVDANPDAARSALRAAVQAGPYDPYRTESRVRTILRLWPVLDASDRVMFQPQFQYLWGDEPDALAQLALDDRVFLIALAMLDDEQSTAGLKERRDAILSSRR